MLNVQADYITDTPKININSLSPEQAARMLAAAGVSFIPIKIDGSKRPCILSWKQYQSDRPTEGELTGWFGNGKTRGIAAIGGAVSGGLEIIDLDAPELREELEALIEEHAPGLLHRLVIVETPKGGRHYYYKCDKVDGNQKLARSADDSTLIETRGTGGYVLTPGCPARCHPLKKQYRFLQGDFNTIPRIKADERDILHNIARTFGVPLPSHTPAGSSPRERNADDSLPGVDFSNRATIQDVRELLESGGWVKLGIGKANSELWRRPGKESGGCSASLFTDTRVFYVHSSNAVPFKAQDAYSPFQVYAFIKHKGDFKAAAEALRKEGYGRQPGLFFHPDTPAEYRSDATIEAHITEGKKSTLALCAFNKASERKALEIGLLGVWDWRGNEELARIEWSNRRVLIFFDANVRTDDSVFRARRALTKELIRRGAIVYHVDLPELPGVNEVDDYLAIEGAEKFTALIEQAIQGKPASRIYYGAEQQDLIPLAGRILEDLAADEEDNPTLFWSGGMLSRVLPQVDQVRIEPLSKEGLSYRLAHLGKWFVEQKKKKGEPAVKVFRTPPQSLLKHILATPMPETPFPILTRTVTAPVFTAAGDLITEPGFHRASGIYHLPTFSALPIPETITDKDVTAAREMIEDILADFPFAEESDRHNAIGLLLLPFVRDLIDGPTPLHLIEAPVPGSGKGLLATALLTPALGRDGEISFTQPTDDPEWSKRITGALISGKGAVVIDNLRAVLESGVLASALTARTWNDRVIGTANSANIPIRCAWIATGNNPSLSSEIARRCVRIRLEPSTDRPEDRTGFTHSNLLKWIVANRPSIVRACHVLVTYWLRQRMPAGQQPFGSYESYAAVIGGILEAAGYREFLANAADFRERADPERTARAELCNEWYEWASKAVSATGIPKTLGATAGQIWENAGCRIEGLPLVGQPDGSSLKSFGRYLAASVGIIPTHTDPDTNKTRRFHIGRCQGLNKGKVHWKITMIEGN